MKLLVLYEAFIVGVMLQAAGMLAPKTPLFVLGALFHIFCELTGINRRYCSTGAACSA